jgi:hypothetical protein
MGFIRLERGVRALQTGDGSTEREGMRASCYVQRHFYRRKAVLDMHGSVKAVRRERNCHFGDEAEDATGDSDRRCIGAARAPIYPFPGHRGKSTSYSLKAASYSLKAASYSLKAASYSFTLVFLPKYLLPVTH